jgi:signal transduction histidine kinase
VAAVGIVALVQLQRLARPLHEDIPQAAAATAHSKYQDSLAQFIRYYDEVLTQSARNFALTRDPKWQQRYLNAEPKLDQAIKQAIHQGDEQDRELFCRVDQANLALVALEYQSLQLAHANRTPEAIQILDSNEYGAQKRIYEKGLTDYAHRRGQEYDSALGTSISRIEAADRLAQNMLRAGRAWLLGVVLAAVLLSVAAGLAFSRSITKPLEQLKTAMTAVGRGSQNVEVEVHSNDEIGQLAVSFREMAANLRETTAAKDSLNREIAERQRAESQLTYLASFPERNSSPILELELDGNIRYANPATSALFPDLPQRGQAHPWLADWATVVRPFREGRNDTVVRDVTIDGRSYEQRFCHFAADGFVRMYGTDITERKKVEEQNHQQSRIQAALNGLLGLSLEDLSTQEILGQAIDQMTSLPWLASSTGVIFLADDKEALMRAAWRGPPASRLTLCERVPSGKCLCGKAASSGQIEFAERSDDRHDVLCDSTALQGHYAVPILSGSKVRGVIHLCVAERHARPRQEEEDFLRAAAAVLAGIIERKDADQKQTELFERLAHINQELNDFAYVVSHDLKAPLRAIKTLADWLSSDCQDQLDPAGRENLQLLGGRVDRMQDLIDGVLQYSRIGHTEQGTVPVDLRQIVPDIIDNLGVPEHIVIRIEPGLPTVEADVTRITQVFQNLLSNAVKYMDKPQGHITIACVKEDSFWKFSVSDDGPGIEQKHFDKIFKLFQTLAARDQQESTGVGLTITRKIVEMYGGKIWVESEVGKGSTFYFTLPQPACASAPPEPLAAAAVGSFC